MSFETILLGLGALMFLWWLTGVIQIANSDNNGIIKLILIILAFALPPFALAYPLRKLFIRDIKNGPKNATKAVKEIAGATIKTAEWLQKNK